MPGTAKTMLVEFKKRRICSSRNTNSVGPPHELSQFATMDGIIAAKLMKARVIAASNWPQCSVGHDILS
jgi:hypothetical protein